MTTMTKRTTNVLIVLVVIINAVCWFKCGNQYGYKHGFERGVVLTLDTVSTILDTQIDSDSTITHLVINDTIEYKLSPKTLKP